MTQVRPLTDEMQQPTGSAGEMPA
ncbi:MAG: hypothetical protein QOI31_101, partial [Solirubrobacterales bacterium]|nr:hypothetical protein [Solirubrobacterales bacterium]